MTHFETNELPVLLELWRADVAGDDPDWSSVVDGTGLDVRADLPEIFWQLQQRGLVDASLNRPTARYIPFPLHVRLTPKGRDKLGEGPDGLDAAFAQLQRSVAAAAAAGADPVTIAEAESYLARWASGARNLATLTEVAAATANLFHHL